MSPTSSKNEDGYVLAFAVVTLVVLSMGMVIAAEQMMKSQLRQIELTKKRDFQLSSYSAQNEISYVLAKEYYSRSVDFLDDTKRRRSLQSKEDYLEPIIGFLNSNYEWHEELLGENLNISGVYVEVHNQRSMIDLNSNSEPFLRYSAERLGADQPQNYVDTLIDYTDEDNFNRPRGAEQADYEETNVIVPNRPLMSVQEVCNVSLWAELDVCKNQLEMARLLYTGNGAFPRFRVASEEVKKLLLAGNYVENNVGLQIGQWENIAQSNGFFELELLGGSAGPEYVLIFKSDPDTGIFRRVDIEVMHAGFPYPIEELNQWDGSFDPLERLN